MDRIINGKGSHIVGPLMVQRHLPNLRGPNQISAHIVSQCKVIELVAGRSALLPYAQAEIAGHRWTRGVHDFSSVTMPLHKSIIDDRPIGYARTAFRYELYFPEAHDPVVVSFLRGNLPKRPAKTKVG
jgi:hypothetical protein